MADEIKLTVQADVVNGSFKDRFQPGQVAITQAAVGAHRPVVSVGTSEEDLSLGDVGTAGICVLRSLDATNYVTYGPRGYTGGGDITAASNATPIVITSATHGLANGDTVVVSGVGGNTAANGTFVVANQAANTFELTGSVGNGAYTSGGIWLKRAMVEWGRIEPGEPAAFRLSPNAVWRWKANSSPVKIDTRVYED